MTTGEPQQHVVTITFQRAWGEWLPRCSCGWVGSYRASRSSSEREGAAHVTDNGGSSDG